MSTLSLRIGNKSIDYVREIEMTFQCPVCLAMETLFLEDGLLTETRHWKQVRGKIYHRDCPKPARLINMAGRRVRIPSNTTIFLVRMLEQRQETIGHFAVSIGVSRITVKRWLLGKCHPNGTSRKRIAKYARTPVSTL